MRQLLSSPVSRLLHEQLAADRRLLRITQAEEEFWQAIHADGRGAVNLTDILYDEVTKANYIGIGVPMQEPDSNRFAGAIDVLMDISGVFPAAETWRPGSTMRTLLVKDDGAVIAGPGTSLSMNVKSREFEAIAEILVGGRGPASILAVTSSGTEEVIGYADTGLRNDYKNLPWLVVVSQDSREALAPVRGVVRLSFLFGACVIVALTLLSVYFSLPRKVKYFAAAMEEGTMPNTKTAGGADEPSPNNG